MTEYSNQLISTNNDYTAFIRSTGSVIPFADVPVNKTVLPSDVASRLDSTSVNEVYGPYYNQADDSYNAFKIIAKTTAPDSIQFRQIQVYADTEAKTATLADSIYNALKVEQILLHWLKSMARQVKLTGLTLKVGKVLHWMKTMPHLSIN